jgi:hypothetical protein
VLDQRKTDILNSDAQIKAEELNERFQIAYLGGRYASGDNNVEYEYEKSGTEVPDELQPSAEDEQQRGLSPTGSGGEPALSGQSQPTGF